jgi:lambda repressor-like predicted transcriptional regulator
MCHHIIAKIKTSGPVAASLEKTLNPKPQTLKPVLAQDWPAAFRDICLPPVKSWGV